MGINGTAEFVFVNYDYLKTMNIQFIENWILPSADTVQGMVINDHLYKRLMEKHGNMDALNAFMEGQEPGSDETRIRIIRVAKDFYYSPAHEALGDFAFWLVRLLGFFIPVMTELSELNYQYDRDYYFDSKKFNDYFNFKPTSNASAVKQTIERIKSL